MKTSITKTERAFLRSEYKRYSDELKDQIRLDSTSNDGINAQEQKKQIIAIIKRILFTEVHNGEVDILADLYIAQNDAYGLNSMILEKTFTQQLLNLN
ncbi:hypothetical protein [Flammeovirga agarivorans]|uniref:Uncharacterized protein n=1 Tax=Flammeovirga agarivorans TaxID=2726742 RepID=A0A7X8SGY2_9BACT|nr:hypothetical protein [Flammeovirga agarivorans]NLR90010.1 hypothetical protein [Flammeovirga agarivorans]